MSDPIDDAVEVITRAMFGLTTPSMSREIAYHLHAAGLLVTPAHDAAVAAKAWAEGHAAGRDYQADGWNSDAHDPAEDNPYREGAS